MEPTGKAPTEADDDARRFRLLVESVKDYAIFILDPRGLVSSWNQGAERIKGYAASEIIGKHFSTFYPEDVVRSGKCSLELDVATRDGRFEEEGWRVRKDGSRFWAGVTITAIRDPDSHALVGFAKVTRDLTERRAAEEDARRFQLLIESVKDYAIFILDPEGNVSTWNPGAQRIKGYAASEIIGKHFSVFYPPEVAKSGMCELELEIAAREGRFEEEGWRVRKDGSRLWANVTITALHDPSSKALVGFAKVTRDLTDRRRHDETLRHLAVETATLTEKARTQEFQERFLGVLGHDLRNPLSALDMGATILRQRAAESNDPVSGRILDRMKASSRRMSRMIEQILDLTRSRLGGGLDVTPASMDLSQMIAAIADELRIANPGRTILVDAPSSVTGEWDPDRLEQVLSNLIGNAVSYSPKDSVVEVTVHENAREVVIRIHNGGAPIPEADRAQLFNPFRRGERDSRVAETAGLGLGLFISREIVVTHGGTLDFRSDAASGTTFLMTLPRSEAKA